MSVTAVRAGAMATAIRATRELSHERNGRTGRSRRARRWTWRRRCAATLLPAAQILPLLRAPRTEDRFQGRKAAAALHLRARQDCPEPDHGSLDQEAARARPGD